MSDRWWEDDRRPGQTAPVADNDRWWEIDQPEHARKGRNPIQSLLGVGGERYQLWPERLAREVGSAAANLFTAPGRAMRGEFGHPTDDLDLELLKEMREGAQLVSPINPAYRAGSRYGAPPRQAGERGTTSPLNPMNEYRWEQGMAPGEQAAVTAGEIGAPLPRGYTGGQGAQYLTQSVRAIPFAGDIINQRVAATRAAAGERVGQVASELGEPGRAGLGLNMRSSFDELVTRNQQAINDAYGNVRSMIDADAVFTPRHTQRAYDDVLRQRLSARQANPEAGLEQVGNMVREGISFNGLIRAKNDLAQTVDFLATHTGLSAGDRKHIGLAMKRDLHEHATHAVRPGATRGQALTAVREAESTAAPLITQNRQLRGMIGSTDESLGGTLIGAGREKGGNVALLAELKRSLPPDQFNQIAGATLHEIGFNPTLGQFTLDRFSTEWGKMSQQSKGVMFTPQHRRFLDDIAQLGTHLKQAEISMNRSGTARPVGLMALISQIGAAGAAAWTGDLSVLLGLTGAATGSVALARAMAQPEIAASAARFARHAIKYDRHPSAATAGALRLATADYMRMMREGQFLDPAEMGIHAAQQLGLSGQPQGGRPYPPGPELPSLDPNAP